jgi:hypothetical protein
MNNNRDSLDNLKIADLAVWGQRHVSRLVQRNHRPDVYHDLASALAVRPYGGNILLYRGNYYVAPPNDPTRINVELITSHGGSIPVPRVTNRNQQTLAIAEQFAQPAQIF